ncbi:hypothetical protein MMB17_00270 [Methylobacterium organophilum]|uniref:DUF6894 family protein n=1 Tax=Methylobacterium organophilum TaxID=410 RepID=UPI001F12B2C8|nr:hypothetical protein [Methylobacterium organophilum]UMY17840.1 hypothetical protein MMB17_00270 [Methylobacterium organophilum]
MPLFYFNIHRPEVSLQDEEGADCPDCGMAFRKAKQIIGRIRDEEQLSDDVVAKTFLQVTYVDGSELFFLPFNLRL